MSDFPVEHLSASSITTFLRCPEQWRDKYVLGNVGPASSALVIGSYAHLLISKALMNKAFDTSIDWRATLAEYDGTEIVWKDTPETAKGIAEAHAYHYYESVGKFLRVIDTEVEVELDFGAPIPILGYVDIVCEDRIIDVKTTGYFNRNVKLNREWKLQGNIYQEYRPVPAEFHVLTRAKKDPLVIPSSTSHELYVPVPEPGVVKRIAWQTYKKIEFMLNEFGPDQPWTGGETHDWAGKYCNVADCCQRR